MLVTDAEYLEIQGGGLLVWAKFFLGVYLRLSKSLRGPFSLTYPFYCFIAFLSENILYLSNFPPPMCIYDCQYFSQMLISMIGTIQIVINGIKEDRDRDRSWLFRPQCLLIIKSKNDVLKSRNEKKKLYWYVWFFPFIFSKNSPVMEASFFSISIRSSAISTSFFWMSNRCSATSSAINKESI